MPSGHRYFVINKPRDMVSQFISSHDVGLLGDLDFTFPEGTHAVGRLDNHSEGLLLLTTNKKITRLLFLAEEPHKRIYLVQVNNTLQPGQLEQLRNGIPIRIKGGGFYTTGKCEVQIIEDPQIIYHHAINNHDHGKHTWLLITLTEGKFRQIRKMISAIRHRCKRLIRIAIEDLQLDDLEPGQVKELNEPEFFERLHIKKPSV